MLEVYIISMVNKLQWVCTNATTAGNQLMSFQLVQCKLTLVGSLLLVTSWTQTNGLHKLGMFIVDWNHEPRLNIMSQQCGVHDWVI